MPKKTEEEVPETPKVAPLELDVVGQLGHEKLAAVIAKLNEVISFINK